MGLELPVREIGRGQSWQNVTGSRALNTTYTNTTGRSIVVEVTDCYSASGVATYTLSVNGQVASRCYPWNTNTYGECGAVIPPGATYRVDTAGSASGYAWFELR